MGFDGNVECSARFSSHCCMNWCHYSFQVSFSSFTQYLYTERQTFCAIENPIKNHMNETVLRNYSRNSRLMQSLCPMMTIIIEWKLLSPKVTTLWGERYCWQRSSWTNRRTVECRRLPKTILGRDFFCLISDMINNEKSFARKFPFNFIKLKIQDSSSSTSFRPRPSIQMK